MIFFLFCVLPQGLLLVCSLNSKNWCLLISDPIGWDLGLVLMIQIYSQTVQIHFSHLSLFDKLGFKINEDYSMTICLTEGGKQTFLDTAELAWSKRDHIQRREAAKLSALIMGSEPRVGKCFLHFRGHEVDRVKALAHNKGDLDARLDGWGAVIPSAGTRAQGIWSATDKTGTYQCSRSESSFTRKRTEKTLSQYVKLAVQLHIDNMTAINYISF